MARKLTEQERENAEALRATLTEALPPAQRGIASGIASALVRVPADTVTDEDLERILGKYEEADEALAKVVKDTLLDAVEGQGGTYTLRVPDVAAEQAQAGEEVSEDGTGEAEPPEGEEPSPEPEDSDGGSPDQAGGAGGGAEAPGEQASGEAPAEAGLATGEEPDAEGDAAGAPAESPEPEEAVTEEPPSPKPKRTRRRAPRTHKSAPSAKGQPDEAATKESTPQDGKPQEPKPKDAKPAKDAKRPKDKAKPKEAKPSKEGVTASDKKDHAKEQASSRDLKKVPYVRRGGESEAETRAKILQLDQRFWVNGWLLSHPGAYTLYEPELVAINDALSDGMLPGDITRRQLAYQMGGDEKFFEYGSDGFRLLRAMGMEDVIRHRPMPKPDLVYYAPRRRKHMRVLVTENLDPYLDVHDLMYEDGRTSILGQRIHAVVLGGGTPILEKNRLALLLDTLGADTITVLYWGDIDRAGLEIMVKLKEVLGDGYKFRAFTPAYQLMVDKAQERFPDPADNESTGQVNIEPLDASLMVKGLTDEAAAYAKAVIDDCGLIPQEILTRRDL